MVPRTWPRCVTSLDPFAFAELTSSDLQQAHRHRKALEYACKKPRDHCVDRALHGGQPINDSMKQSDDEPILGSRHKGIWSINGEQLHDIPPQIQVLMARALRDVAQPKSLQPYDHPESTKFLNKAAPWFLQLLEPVSIVLTLN